MPLPRNIALETYAQCLEHIYKLDEFKINLGLQRIKQLLELLGKPQDSLKIIHVAGTNGKGSVIAMLESILLEAGYKTCAFTSPHLIKMTERYRINKQPVQEYLFIKQVQVVQQTINAYKKTYPELNSITCFEFMSAVAFLLFKEVKPDFTLLEVGLGGKLDATNVITQPLLSIITSIGLDHTDILGKTLETIAQEKAGIIKPHSQVIASISPVTHIFEETASRLQTSFHLVNPKTLKTTGYHNGIQTIQNTENGAQYTLNLLGIHQLENLSLVLNAIDILQKQGYHITPAHLQAGLQNVFWEGRFHFIPAWNVLFDGAHNPPATTILRKNLDTYFPHQKRLWIFGALQTKNYQEMVQELFTPHDTIILVPTKYKTTNIHEIFNFLRDNKGCTDISLKENMDQALDGALSLSNKNCLIIVTGSLYLVGEGLEYIKNAKSDKTKK